MKIRPGPGPKVFIRFRSFEADPKIAHQGFLEKKLLEQFNKQS
jgi:hypothetical protein